MKETNIEMGDEEGVSGGTTILSRVVRKGLRKKVRLEGRSEGAEGESHVDMGEWNSRQRKEQMHINVLRLEAAWCALGTAKLPVPLEHSHQGGE